MSSTYSRRGFVAGLAGVAALPVVWHLGAPRRASDIPGDILGANSRAGHLLREGRTQRSTPHQSEEHNVIIVGSGIAALSAAWWLTSHGVQDVVLLELEANPGGNSQSGRNSVSAYPWGAHYLPLPNPESTYVHRLLEQLGAITGHAPDGSPLYREEYLCQAPQERLFLHGRWQEGGLYPSLGASAADQAEYTRFMSLMDEFRHAVGHDGKPAFTIPIAMSSTDPTYRILDTVSFASWLDDHDFSSTPLHWYLTYCCRDDYGSTPEHISAWAGIHYFASRRPSGHVANGPDLFTWPEGNGWLVQGLRRLSGALIRTERLATKISQQDGVCEVDALNLATQETERYRAHSVIYAGPQFSAHRIIEGLADRSDELSYNPWLVANLTIQAHETSSFRRLAWDNVLYHGAGLGYVHAQHQDLSVLGPERVITYYLPLSKEDPRKARTEALASSAAEWKALILADLAPAHPDIVSLTQRIDIWIWGHAMINPSPGFLWGSARAALEKSIGRIHFAHSDMSGISIFEEANYQGVQAAERVRADLGLHDA